LISPVLNKHIELKATSHCELLEFISRAVWKISTPVLRTVIDVRHPKEMPIIYLPLSVKEKECLRSILEVKNKAKSN